jgi:4-amino-4-deoxy-L-arabinose transferase-like glycosyltransferase
LSRSTRLLEIIALCLILALAAYLRLANVSDNPGWYTDEGTHLDIAQNLLRGRVQYLAIDQSTLMFAKLPLFELLLAGLLGTIGGGIVTLRTFTGVLGVVSAGMLYWVVRRTQRGRDLTLALLAALMLAIYPQATVYSRFGFSYNLLTPLVLLTMLGCWEYLSTSRRCWLALAALAIGLGGVSDLWMFTLLAPLALTSAIRRDWRHLLWNLWLALLPFGIYAGVMLATASQAFLFDLNFTVFRLSKLSLTDQARILATNYSTLIFQDTWVALGVVGLLLLRPARLRRLSLLLLLFPILVLGRTTALYSLGFYYMIPLLPFIGLGMATLLRYGVPCIWQTVYTGPLNKSRSLRFATFRAGTVLILLIFIAAPFITSLGFAMEQVHDGFMTPIDSFLLDSNHARLAAEFVNGHTEPDDVVIASPTLAWLIEANVADVQMATVAAGYPAPDLPANIPADRFAFDPHYGQARFVIVDNLWRNWAVENVPGVPDLLHEVGTWPLAFEAGEIRVYENPN